MTPRGDRRDRPLSRQNLDDLSKTLRQDVSIAPRGLVCGDGKQFQGDLILNVVADARDIALRASSEEQARPG